MRIRLAEKTDFVELMCVYIKMNEVINKRTDLYNEENTYFPSREMVMEAIEQGQQYVCIEDEKIVAACIANHDCDDAYQEVHWQIDADTEEFTVLHALRVLPEYEGRGFARQLIEFLLDQAVKTGQKAIRLDVLEGYEGPERMYRAYGFEHVDTMEIFYEDIGRPVRFKLLEKVL